MAPSGVGTGAQPPPASRAQGPHTDNTCPLGSPRLSLRTDLPGASTGSLTPDRGWRLLAGQGPMGRVPSGVPVG